jgi:hypothetical protein
VSSDPLLNEVRRFSERHLPSRGWKNVLVVESDAAAELLVERGYDVNGAGPYDAVVGVETRELRRGGLLVTSDGLRRKRLFGRVR